ncbi:TMC domain-containing protein [Caenorhabditis elegans]|uniref:TMC domain-containing protein n=2 Tax=Caenorhabditis elegans TaxID=6239 RepID=A0A1N7SYS6_CAEEL|nr:TMC domain-containing protein [Caenorhabditis elegans]SIT60454.1 TMC domain-containing protein [Caenorhabditis elegans]|eukprot:NP_001335564.1 Transmembrane channel-like protein 2 [Caenorhabditis elegans]
MPKSGAHQPLVRHDTDDGGETGQSVKSLADVSEEEIDSRMSRRSSVIADLLSLFRRSSSVLVRPHTRLGNPNFDDDDDEFDEEDDKEASKDRILKKIQQKKEIIQKLRGQPWYMKRKRRTLKVAQKHLQQQEAKVSKARLYKAEAGRRLTQASRWLDNLKIYLIPWEAKIRKIESHFGSVVSSYFTFHRWVLGVNITITFIMCMFVVIPEWLADSRTQFGDDRYNKTKAIKVMPPAVRARADELSTVWDFGGYFQYSLLFYGFYSKETFFGETIKYRVPVAYFFCNIFILGFSLFIILRKMAANNRRGTLSSGKTQQYLFNWKAFTGWDYTIGNPETAGNVYMANVIKFREAINDDKQKPSDKHPWIRFVARVLTNLFICAMYVFSIWAIMQCGTLKGEHFFAQNATAITISLITLVFPNIFDLLGKIEKLHPRNALRFQLGRVLVLYILNYYTLIYSLMLQLEHLQKEKNASDNPISALGHPGDAIGRTIRETVLPRYPVDNNPHTYYSYAPVTTTPIPATSSWTTVLPDFGPFGVYNPKASVTKDDTVFSSPVVETHMFGPNSDWNETTVNAASPTGATTRASLRMSQGGLCWETIIGQEITKLVTMDLYMTVASIFLIDFLRGLACRYLNLYWPWDLERTFPEYGEFKVAENVLHLVNNQGMIWLGLFFVPLLPMLNNIKLIILMYIRGWAAMTCNVPASQIFRASRSSNFFFALLILFLFLCTLPVGFVIASKTPSKSCGPFGNQSFFYSVITDVLHENLDKTLVNGIKYSLSPGIIIPVLVLLSLVIYFLIAMVTGLSQANQDLSFQLMVERTEEKKKIFELAGGKKKKSKDNTFGKQKPKQLLPPPTKGVSSDDDSQHNRSTAKSVSGRQFVPSLGSVSEVDHSTGEEQSSDSESTTSSLPPKLSLRQRFLVCIGWADPNKYGRHDDIEMEEGGGRLRELSTGSETDSDDEDSEKRNSESRYLLPPDGSRPASRERSENPSKRSSQSRRTSNRDMSYRTAIQSFDQNSQSASASSSKSTTTAPSNSEMRMSSASSSSSSHQPSSSIEKQAARRLLQPISTTHNIRYGVATVENSSQDPTRPPSTDDSLGDPALHEPLWANLNPHSSYTSAMMSPIMNEVMSNDETTDDEKGRLIPDRPPIPHSPRELKRLKREKDQQSESGSKPSTPRPPRFRISMSPPRKPPSEKNDSDSSNRKYEMRVEKSPKKPKKSDND